MVTISLAGLSMHISICILHGMENCLNMFKLYQGTFHETFVYLNAVAWSIVYYDDALPNEVFRSICLSDGCGMEYCFRITLFLWTEVFLW